MKLAYNLISSVILVILLAGAASATIFGDLDGDLDIDIYAKDVYMNINGTFFNLTNGTGLPTIANVINGGIADVDGDGDNDVYVVISGSQNRLYINDGTGQFTLDTTFSNIKGSASGSKGFYVGRISNDTRVDIFTDDTLFLWNSTCPCFSNVTAAAALTGFNNMKQVVAADMLASGKRDLLGVTATGTVRYFYNQGDNNGDGVDEYADSALVTGIVLSNTANSIAIDNFNADDPLNPNTMDVYIAENGPNKLWIGNLPLIPGIVNFPAETAATAGVDDAANTAWAATGIFDNVSAWVPPPFNLVQAQNTKDIFCANTQNDTEYTRNGTIGAPAAAITFANRTLNITQSNVTPTYAEADDLNGDGFDDIIIVGSTSGVTGFVASYVISIGPGIDAIYEETWASTSPITFDSTGFTGGGAPPPSPTPTTDGGPGTGTPGGDGKGIPKFKADKCVFTAYVPMPRWQDDEEIPFEFLDKSFVFSKADASIKDGIVTFQMTGPFRSNYDSQTVLLGDKGWQKNPRIIIDVSSAPGICGPILEMPVPLPDCSAAYLEQVPPAGSVVGYVQPDASAGAGNEFDTITGSALGIFGSDEKKEVYLSLFPWSPLAFTVASDRKHEVSSMSELIAPIRLEAKLLAQDKKIELNAILLRTSDNINLMAVLDDKEKAGRLIGTPLSGIPSSNIITLPPEFSRTPENPDPIIDIKRGEGEDMNKIIITSITESGTLIGKPISIPGTTVIAPGPDATTVVGDSGKMFGTTFVPGAQLGTPDFGDIPVYIVPQGAIIDGKPATAPVKIIPVDPPTAEDCFGTATTTANVITGDTPKGTTNLDLSLGSIDVNFLFGTTGIVASRKGADTYSEQKIFIQMQEPEPKYIATISIGEPKEEDDIDTTGSAVSDVHSSYRNYLFVAALSLFAVLAAGVFSVYRKHKKLSSMVKLIENKSKDDETRFS